MLGLLDLSIVTDQLIDQLKAYKNESHIWPRNPDGSRTPGTIEITGLAPDAIRNLEECQLCVYPFHVAPDKFHRNTYPTGGPAQRIPEQPLALTVHYLVSACAKTYVDEQQAMSIALKFFHEHPRVTAVVAPDRKVELTLTLEPQTVDELGRLWQAFATPMRMSAVYRVGVVFLEPPAEPVVAKQVEEHGWTVQAVPILPIPTVTTTAGRAEIVVAGAGFGAATEVVLHETGARPSIDLPLAATATDPPEPGRFRVVDAETLDVQVPAASRKVGYLTFVRPAPGKATLAVWLEVR